MATSSIMTIEKIYRMFLYAVICLFLLTKSLNVNATSIESMSWSSISSSSSSSSSLISRPSSLPLREHHKSLVLPQNAILKILPVLSSSLKTLAADATTVDSYHDDSLIFQDKVTHLKAPPQHLQRRLEIGDFDILNERWGKTLLLRVNDTNDQSSIVGFPLTLSLQNITCINFAIGDVQWEWVHLDNPNPAQFDKAATENRSNITLFSNFTVVDFSIDCFVDYSWDYLAFGSSGKAELKSSNSTLDTSFTLTVPETNNYEFLFDVCNPSVNVKELNFIGDSPIDQVLDALADLLRGTVSSQIEDSLCAVLSELQQSFSDFLSNLTDSLTSKNDNNNGGSYSDLRNDNNTNNITSLLDVENSMVVPESVQLVNWLNITNDTSSIGTLVNLFSKISGIEFMNNATDTGDSNSDNSPNSSSPSSFLSNLFTNGVSNASTDNGGIVIDLSNNTVLNGETGFLTSLTSPKNTSLDSLSSMFTNLSNNTNNQSGILYNLFGIRALRVMKATLASIDENSDRDFISVLLQDFKGIQVLGNYTLSLTLNIQSMKIGIDTEIEREMISSQSEFGYETDLVQVQFSTSSFNFETALLVAVDEMKLGSVKLGSLLHGTYAVINCLLGTLYEDLQLTGFFISSFEILETSIDGLESPGMDRIMTTAMEYFTAALKNKVADIISTFVSELDLQGLLGSNDMALENSTTTMTCPEPVKGTNDVYLNYFELLLPANESLRYGASGLEPYGNLTSGLIGQITSALLTLTNITLPGTLVNYATTFEVGKGNRAVEGYMEFLLSEVRIVSDGFENDTSILQVVPTQRYAINNTLTVGKTNLGGDFEIALDLGELMRFRNVFRMTVDFKTLSVVLTILAKVFEDSFLTFPIQDVLIFDCWMSIFPAQNLDGTGNHVNTTDLSLAIQNLSIAVQEVTLNISCIECMELIEQTADVLRKRDFSGDIQWLVESITNTILSGYPSVVQRELDQMVSNAPMRCPHNPAYDASLEPTSALQTLRNFFLPPDSFAQSINNESSKTNGRKNAIMFIVSIVVVGVLVVVAVFTVRWMIRTVVHRRFQKMIATLQRDEVLAIVTEQLEEDKKYMQMDLSCGAMYKHKSIPRTARWIVPTTLITASVLFWLGLFLPSMVIMLLVSVDGNTPLPLVTLPFTLAGFSSDWWAAGQRIRAVLMVLSLIWPQIKIFLTIFVWFAPVSIISVTKRGSILRWIDFLGKWSALFLFITMIATAMFQGTIKSGIYILNFFYVPAIGMFTILFGHMLNEVTCKVLLRYHLNIIDLFEVDYRVMIQQGKESNETTVGNFALQVGQDFIVREEATEQPNALYKSDFEEPHSADSTKLKIRTSMFYGFIALCLFINLALIIGCVRPSFEYELSGVIGWLLTASNQSSGSLSIFTMASRLMNSATLLNEGKYYVFLGLLCGFLFATLLVVPMIQTILLLLQWLYPMNVKSLLKCQAITVILESWQTTEVYVVAILACSLQLSKISSFMAKRYCKSLTEAIQTTIYLGFIDKKFGDQCIEVDARIKPSILCFVVVAGILFFLRFFIADAINHKIKQQRNMLLPISNVRASTNLTVSQQNLADHIEKIRPAKIYFTDRFRWVLCIKESNATLLSPQGINKTPDVS